MTRSSKHSIKLGTYGWRHDRWQSTFYPDDLPVDSDDDWRLSYFSNMFDAVLVPADYWHYGEEMDCSVWLDDVHDDFRFFIELDAAMFAEISVPVLAENLLQLQPQLAGLVCPGKKCPAALNTKMHELLTLLRVSTDVTLYDDIENNVWYQDKQQASRLALIDDDVSDLRMARQIAEAFVASADEAAGSKAECDDLSIIVRNGRLMPDDLEKFRSLLEIMGHR